MRAAYVCADRGVPIFGMKGCSLHVQDVVREFLKRGIKVDFFAASKGGSPPTGLSSRPVYRITREQTRDRSSREQADLLNNEKIASLLSSKGSYDFVYERYSLWNHAGMEYAREIGVPGIVEVNAPLIEEQARYRGLIDRDAACDAARRCFAAASCIVAVSEGVADYLQSFPQTRGKVIVVPNGVNPARFRPLAFHQVFSGPLVTLGFVGTLKPWHGVGQLIEAFRTIHACYRNTRLLIVGDGPEYAALREQSRAAGLENSVVFTGSVSSDRIPDLLSRMDIGIAPYPESDDFYFSPLKVFEYMAAGLPVVASRIGQLASILQHGQTGLLYEAGNQEALVKAISTLVDDGVFARALGRKARETILLDHTWDIRVEKILDAAGVGRTMKLGQMKRFN